MLTYSRQLIFLFCLAFLSGGFACGRQAAEARLAPEALVRQQAGFSVVSPLQADTATSLMDTRPPIDEKNTPYLFPHEHPDLPTHIAAWLDERGYVIPQGLITETSGRINVVAGEFANPGQQDIAVYCTNRETSSIIMFWGSAIDSISQIDKMPTSTFESDGFSDIELFCCSYYISKARPDSVRLHLGKVLIKPFDEGIVNHDGLLFGLKHSDAYLLYFTRNRWYVLSDLM